VRTGLTYRPQEQGAAQTRKWPKAHLPSNPNPHRAVEAVSVTTLSGSQPKCPVHFPCDKTKNPEIRFNFFPVREAHHWDSRPSGRSIHLISRLCVFNQDQSVSYSGLQGPPSEADEMRMNSLCLNWKWLSVWLPGVGAPGMEIGAMERIPAAERWSGKRFRAGRSSIGRQAEVGGLWHR
jgi:hypothetical protein